jgi:hypothetical protein
MNARHDLRSAAVLILLAVLLVALYNRLLLGEVFIWGLPPLQFYPWRAYALDVLASGQLPLWNPYNGAGAPLFANYQSSLLYPPSWISFAFPLASTMSITAVAHLVLAGWGMWTFTGQLGYSALGRAVSTLAFAMTSYLVARLGTFPMISAAAWLPWLLWASLCVVRLRRAGDVGRLAFFTAMLLLAGHAQTAWYSLLLTGLFALWSWLRLRPLHRLTPVMLVCGVLLGAGIAALQLLATGELLLSSQRASGVDFDVAMNFSYIPLRALNLISPNIFGNPGDASVLGIGAFFEDAVYIGLIPLISALAAVITWLRTRRHSDCPAYMGDVVFWLSVVLVAFVFALGRHTPIFPFLYNNVPTFDLFQAPVRWHLWTVTGLAILAGAGVNAWARIGVRWTARLTVICIAAVVMGLLGQLVFTDPSAETIRVMLRGVLVTGLIGTAAGLLTLRMPRVGAQGYGRWAIAALILIGIDLGWAAQGLNVTTSATFDAQAGDTSAARGYWSPEALDRVQFGEYFLFDDYQVAVERWEEARQSQLPNLNLLDGRPLLNNFDPLRPGYFVQYTALIEDNPDDAATLLNAAHVDGVFETQGVTQRLPDVSERAWLVEAACWHSRDFEASAALLAAGWDRRLQVQLSGDGACDDADAARSLGSVRSIEDRPNETIIAVDVQAAAWLVIADTYYPGWRAEVNGAPATIQRANLAFRAVQLQSGENIVRMVYEPGWLAPGAIISALSLFALFILFRIRDVPSTDARTNVELR